MFGFIVTTHFNNYEIIKKCLNLLFSNIPNESFIVLYVNETKCNKVLNIKNDFLSLKDKFDIIYIDNQEKNGGLTGTWNQGINYLLNKKDFNCKVITILGHDTYVNKDIKYLLDSALDAENNKKLQYFGPLYKNYENKTDELWQDELYYKNYTKKFIIGSLFTFPVHCLKKNKLNKNSFFDADRFPFGYNDIDWYNRFVKIGGNAIIIPQCIIDHKYERTWMAYDKNIRNRINNGTSTNVKSTNVTSTNVKSTNVTSTNVTSTSVNNVINENKANEHIVNDNEIEKLFLVNKIDELNFNWKNYLIKNRDLQNKGIRTQKDALNHYLTIGKHQNRMY